MVANLTWTDIVAGLAILLSTYSVWLARCQRRDSLFELRFKFYQRLSQAWVSTRDGPDMDVEDLIPYAEEAEFLFGRGVSQHVMSLARKSHKEGLDYPGDNFTTPFRNYLTLDAPWWQRAKWKIDDFVSQLTAAVRSMLGRFKQTWANR